jgi:membrane protease YdiL (CAAX protease family)
MRFYWMYTAMLVSGVALAALTGCPRLFVLPPTPAHLWISLAAALAVAGGIIFGSRAMISVPWFRAMAALIKRLLMHPDLLGPELDTSRALPLAAYSSLAEEAFFRGFVQPWLILHLASLTHFDPSHPGPLLGGVLLTSLLFGGIHFPVLKELRPWTLFAILVGVAFGLLAALSGSLIAPILAHLLINWRNLVWLAKEPKLEPADLETLFGGGGD